MQSIFDAVESVARVSRQELCGKSRRGDIVVARHAAMIVARERYKMRYSEIGKLFGGRNHATVCLATRKMYDPLIRELVTKINAWLDDYRDSNYAVYASLIASHYAAGFRYVTI
jgi:chromosomal replication initiation ATPase DnaA